jgi:hypothetical protein
MEQWMSLRREDEEVGEVRRSSRRSRPSTCTTSATRATWRGRLVGGTVVLLTALIALPGSAGAQQAPYPAPEPPSSYPPPPPPPGAPQPPPGNYYQPPPGNYPQPPPGNYSQPPPGTYYQPPPGSYYPPAPIDARGLRVGRRMRAAGIALTSVGIVGSAIFLAGIGVLFDPYGDPYVGADLIGAGVVIAAVGFGAGIPLWAVGQRKINKARRPGLVMAPWIAPTRSLALGTTGATGAVGGVTLRF